MPNMDVQQEILDTLTGLKGDVDHLKSDMHQIIEHLEDARLTEGERKLLQNCLEKIKQGNESDFISHQELQRELEL